MVERRLLARGRADDTADVIVQRLRQYEADTEPLVEHYRERGVLVEVDGDRPADEIAADLLGRSGLGHRGERRAPADDACGTAQRLDHVLDERVSLARRGRRR